MIFSKKVFFNKDSFKITIPISFIRELDIKANDFVDVTLVDKKIEIIKKEEL